MPINMIESMTKLNIHAYKVRIWRQEKALTPIYDRTEIHDLAAKLRASFPDIPTSDEIAKAFAELPRVNAVEVTVLGNGLVVYNDWP